MAVLKPKYASSTAFGLTLASLASSATAGRESDSVDNTTDRYVDAIVQVAVTLQSGSPANDKVVYVYAYGSEDGTIFTDNATGANAAITLRNPTACVILGTIPTPDSGALKYESQPMSVAAAFGGFLPREWGIIVRNYTGLTLSATEGDHSYKYTGVHLESV